MNHYHYSGQGVPTNLFPTSQCACCGRGFGPTDVIRVRLLPREVEVRRRERVAASFYQGHELIQASALVRFQFSRPVAHLSPTDSMGLPISEEKEETNRYFLRVLHDKCDTRMETDLQEIFRPDSPFSFIHESSRDGHQWSDNPMLWQMFLQGMLLCLTQIKVARGAQPVPIHVPYLQGKQPHDPLCLDNLLSRFPRRQARAVSTKQPSAFALTGGVGELLRQYRGIMEFLDLAEFLDSLCVIEIKVDSALPEEEQTDQEAKRQFVLEAKRQLAKRLPVAINDAFGLQRDKFYGDFRVWVTEHPEHFDHVLLVAFIGAGRPLPQYDPVPLGVLQDQRGAVLVKLRELHGFHDVARLFQNAATACAARHSYVKPHSVSPVSYVSKKGDIFVNCMPHDATNWLGLVKSTQEEKWLPFWIGDDNPVSPDWLLPRARILPNAMTKEAFAASSVGGRLLEVYISYSWDNPHRHQIPESIGVTADAVWQRILSLYTSASDWNELD